MPNLVGPSAIGFAGPTSQFWSTPFPHRPGDKGRDQNGNEYVFCDYTATVYYGMFVMISSDYLASPLLGTIDVGGRVGIVMSGDATTNSNPTSDNGGWVQVYGLNQIAQTGSASGGLVSDQTVDYVCVAQTSIGTPSGTFSLLTQVAGTSIEVTSTDLPRIYGMWLVPATGAGQTLSDLGLGVLAVTMWGASGASGPQSDPNRPTFTSASFTSFDATSAYIGSHHVVFLNYPYVTGIPDQVGIITT